MTGTSEPTPTAPTARGEQTRTLLVDTALRLFREQGYEKTTMRAVAAAAGVSVGNAYYYFAGKEDLVQAFYGQTHTELVAASRPVLDHERDFEARLLGVMRARVDTLAPYREFAGQFFTTAADPTSPLSPFSDASDPAREQTLALFREIVTGSTTRIGPDLARELPELLWLYTMGVVMFWVHDRSPGAARTYLLVTRTVPIIAKLVRISRYPVLRGVLDDVLALRRDLRSVSTATSVSRDRAAR